MLINWFTVVAQVINFLILVWLLKHFLYKPILDTIDERERKVVKRLSDADARMKEAGKEQEEYRHKNQELEQHRTESLAKAERDAEAERQRLLDQARKEYEEKRSDYSEILTHEEQRLMQTLSSRTRKEVFAIARKTLADMANAGVEKSMVDVFLQQLHSLGGNEKEEMAAGYRSSPEPVTIRTGMDLPSEQKETLEQAIAEMLGTSPQCQYETVPDLIGGIEVTVSGKKIAWSIREYLSNLENDVHDIIKRHSNIESPPASGRELNARDQVDPNHTGPVKNGS